MGTNYYWNEKSPCKSCGHQPRGRHIGKSSAGWCFGLHVYPEDGIRDLGDWESLWAKQSSEIRDEYGEIVSLDEMRAVILARVWKGERDLGDQWYADNYASRGPNGLARHEYNCIGHPDGTYDLLTGDFS